MTYIFLHVLSLEHANFIHAFESIPKRSRFIIRTKEANELHSTISSLELNCCCHTTDRKIESIDDKSTCLFYQISKHSSSKLDEVTDNDKWRGEKCFCV
ncbi:hypothetical protein CDAR_320901 [Caerostris darwini]|uniref:Uncharacterized protein n=1 Tax=Caerostris darwini TaxID=1538125 RepID=A0AAV4WX23_9ARAC|nr:hypothetical protein CDAR_320901 [Caerostris darwini]